MQLTKSLHVEDIEQAINRSFVGIAVGIGIVLDKDETQTISSLYSLRE